MAKLAGDPLLLILFMENLHVLHVTIRRDSELPWAIDVEW